MDHKKTPKTKTEGQIFRELKKDRISRKTFLEFYHRLQTDKDFRDGYLNALKE